MRGMHYTIDKSQESILLTVFQKFVSWLVITFQTVLQPLPWPFVVLVFKGNINYMIEDSPRVFSGLCFSLAQT